MEPSPLYTEDREGGRRKGRIDFHYCLLEIIDASPFRPIVSSDFPETFLANDPLTSRPTRK
jgi:hypothetical protein